MSVCRYATLPACLPARRPVLPSVRMEQLGYHWTGFHKIWYQSTFRKSIKKIQVSLNPTITSTLREGQHTFMISGSILLRNEWCWAVQKIKTHVSCSVTFFFEYRAVYEARRKDVADSVPCTLSYRDDLKQSRYPRTNVKVLICRRRQGFNDWTSARDWQTKASKLLT
jgi:hypothetical protein